MVSRVSVQNVDKKSHALRILSAYLMVAATTRPPKDCSIMMSQTTSLKPRKIPKHDKKMIHLALGHEGHEIIKRFLKVFYLNGKKSYK